MNCPYCSTDIAKKIDDFVESTGHCFGFIFVCPECERALGVRTDRQGKTEELR